MINATKILLIDENLNDAELIRSHLIKAEFNFDWLHVSELENFKNALTEFNPDIILSDYHFTGFNGSDVLKIAKETEVDVPFILITGNLKEEITTDIIKQGAYDYLFKENLNRLNVTIRNAIQSSVALNDIIELKKSENALNKQIEFINSLLKSSSDIIYIYDLENQKNIYSNNAIEVILGYSAQELKSFENVIKLLMHPDDFKNYLESIIPRYQLINDNELIENEFRMKSKNGEWIWLSTRESVYKRNEKGIPINIFGIISNISEKKNSEKEMKNSEEKFRRAVTLSPLPIMLHDEDDNVLQLSKGWTDFSGYTINDIPTISDWTLKAYGSAKGTEKEYINNLFGIDKTVEEGKWKITAKNGEKRIWDFKTTPIGKDSKGRRLLHSLAIDVTERKRADVKLHQSSQLLEASQSIARVGGWELDLTTNNLFWTAETYRIHDTTPEEFNPTVDAGVSYFLPESRRLISDALEVAIDKGEGYDLELETLTTKGRHIYVRTTCEVTLKEDRPSKLTGIFQDITDKKIAENELKASEEKFRNLADTAQVSIAIVAPSNKKNILYVNNYWQKSTGYTEEESLKMGILDVIHPDHRLMVIERATKRIAGENVPDSYELKILTKSGETKWVDLTAIRIEYEGIPASLTTAIDITHLKKVELEIKTFNQELEERVIQRTVQLEEVNKELGAFSYSVSHDLKAPLRAITGFSQILIDEYADQLDSEAQRYINLVKLNAENMGELIKDLLNLSRTGRMKLRKREVDLVPISQRVKDELLGGLKDGDISIVIGALPLVYADETHMYQLILNLLSNGVKFTSQNKKSVIEIGSFKKEDKNVFFVKDNGIGFDMKYADKIFEVFQRLHNNKEFDGTGIGLAIVRRIITMHLGEIWVESEKEKGTTFFFTLN